MIFPHWSPQWWKSIQHGKTNFSDFETNVPNYFVGCVCVCVCINKGYFVRGN